MSLKAFNLEYLVGHHNIISPLCSLVVFYGEVDHPGNRMGARPLSMVCNDDDGILLLFHHQKQHRACGFVGKGNRANCKLA